MHFGAATLIEAADELDRLHLFHLDQRAGVMARTFGTCERDARSRMVRTSGGDGAGRRVEPVKSGNDPAVVVRDITSQG